EDENPRADHRANPKRGQAPGTQRAFEPRAWIFGGLNQRINALGAEEVQWASLLESVLSLPVKGRFVQSTTAVISWSANASPLTADDDRARRTCGGTGLEQGQ